MLKDQQFAFIGVDPIIVDNGKIVLARRGAEAEVHVGEWHIPGALVLAGETLSEALKRAIKEKTGLEIELLREEPMNSFVAFYDTPTREPRYHDVAMSFLCRVVGGQMKPGPRMTEVKAFTPNELKTLTIGFDHRQIVLDAVDKLRQLKIL